ncbi:tetratricopeptide repeat protein [Gammaproteobacteria bacterium]|nr:tetratricopeptide repeat protein [Gammaproteobacteria bacterium]
MRGKRACGAIALEDSDNRPRVTLGWAYINGGQIDKGVAEIKKGIALNPNDAGVLARSGYALTYAGEFEQAIDNAERAMRINPFHPSYYYDVLGWAQYFLRQYDDALRTMANISKASPAQHRTLAAIYARLGQVDNARDHAKKILELDPEFALSRYGSSQLCTPPPGIEWTEHGKIQRTRIYPISGHGCNRFPGLGSKTEPGSNSCRFFENPRAELAVPGYHP